MLKSLVRRLVKRLEEIICQDCDTCMLRDYRTTDKSVFCTVAENMSCENAKNYELVREARELLCNLPYNHDRNADFYSTAEDAHSAFLDFCGEHRCRTCKLFKKMTPQLSSCELIWLFSEKE